MCDGSTFDLHSALHVLSELAAGLEEIDESGSGPVATSAVIGVNAREISIGFLQAADLREAHRRLQIEATDLYGDVTRPQASGRFVHHTGWTVVVFGPAGLTVLQ